MLQLRKQHHVHILNPETGTREPVTACRRKDNPKLCKGDFRRTLWLIEKAVVSCPDYRMASAIESHIDHALEESGSLYETAYTQTYTPTHTHIDTYTHARTHVPR